MSETDRRPEGPCSEKNHREESKKKDYRAKIFVNPEELILIFSSVEEEKKT